MIIHQSFLHAFLITKGFIFAHIYKYERIDSDQKGMQLLKLKSLLPEKIEIDTQHLYLITLRNRFTGYKIYQLFMKEHLDEIIIYDYGTHYVLQYKGYVIRCREQESSVLKSKWLQIIH